MFEQEHHSQDYVPMITGSKEERYQRVQAELCNRLDSNSHPLSNTSNLLAILEQEFNWWWIGFYWLTTKGNNECLSLGQFQGPPACTKLFKGAGVCGTAWKNKCSIILQDVNKFEGHIACSSLSKSQIVIPILIEDAVVGVLDIDAANYGQFDEIDEKWLKIILKQFYELKQFDWFCKSM